MAGDVIDIEAEEVTEDGRRIRRGMRRRRARTGHGGEKPLSRMFWISFGAIVTVLTLRAFESYFPRQRGAPGPQPQPSLPPAEM